MKVNKKSSKMKKMLKTDELLDGLSVFSSNQFVIHSKS